MPGSLPKSRCSSLNDCYKQHDAHQNEVETKLVKYRVYATRILIQFILHRALNAQSTESKRGNCWPQTLANCRLKRPVSLPSGKRMLPCDWSMGFGFPENDSLRVMMGFGAEFGVGRLFCDGSVGMGLPLKVSLSVTMP